MIDYNLYHTEINEIDNKELNESEKLLELKKLLERFARDLTITETIQFPNLFSRLVFISQKYKLSKKLEWQLQNLRVESQKIKKQETNALSADKYNKHVRSFQDLIHIVSGDINLLEEELEDFIMPITPLQTEQSLRVEIIHIDKKASQFICVTEKNSAASVVVKYNVEGVNDTLNESTTRFWVGAQLNLIDYSIDKEGALIPKLFVLEPDYLIDASSLAECFQDYCTSPMHYFRNKFETIENRSYILLGNLANYFLDELVFAEDIDKVSFEETFFQSFKQSPFEYTSCEDIEEDNDFRAFMIKAKEQFNNIKRVVSQDFKNRSINLQQCTLEPSFFSELYGVQGRLDMLHADKNEFKIIELKSGKLPYPAQSMGKIALNHEVQTAIYRLLIESVFKIPSRNIQAAILYSSGSVAGSNLRFAAEYKQLKKDIINVRNHVVANEHLLINGNNDTVEKMFDSVFHTVTYAKSSAKFYAEKISGFKQVLQQANSTEKSYFFRFIRFISRELYLQKIGDIDYESPTGVASLWNSSFAERAEALDVFFNLTIDDVIEGANGMNVVFKRNNIDNDIVNFREGEICIVYPRQNDDNTVLNNQVLKGTVAAITKDRVEVLFRYKQRNKSIFKNNRYWAIEHDTLDTSYNQMYKGLFDFMGAAKQKRELLLGMRMPENRSSQLSNKNYPENIIQDAIAAPDYFLIVGPPGTGKTSIFARRLIEEYYAKPLVNILVLAYTNRAVDELCDTINAAMGCKDQNSDQYIRIGTSLSCQEKYKDRLLQTISAESASRDELRKKIHKTRIFVSTLASICGKQELFALKKFDIAIIDEASQILEPQIIGLLPKFSKFIMIGDHHQLPAIVLQKNHISKVSEPELQEIGIHNCAHSFFERLFNRAHANNWNHVHAQLTHQGRMHNEISMFPSLHFYPQRLISVSEWQSEPWHNSEYEPQDLFEKTVAQKRVAFFSTENISVKNNSNKINTSEAIVVTKIIKALEKTYRNNHIDLKKEDIGIITPYRNQIALIKHQLQEADIAEHHNIMVDTVERFQGSQRNIIIVSFCVSKPYQLNFLCNLNDAGTVDRKLNVTLTRARHQMFLVGNASVLSNHYIYATLLEHYKDNTFICETND